MVSSPSEIHAALKEQQNSLLWAALALRLNKEAQVFSAIALLSQLLS